jgi:hypothetical protein
MTEAFILYAIAGLAFMVLASQDDDLSAWEVAGVGLIWLPALIYLAVTGRDDA